MAVKLEFGSFGTPDKPPLLILHGLLGSSRNWMSVGQTLADSFNIFAIDLRNHGNSPHAETHTYEEMIVDLEHWLLDKNIDQFYLLGHSMGGKVAMGYACQHPDRVKGLIVEDIAPKVYSHRWAAEFEAMQELDLASLKSRRDADQALELKIKDWGMRQFVMTNLARNPESGFTWQVNLPVLINNLEDILGKAVKDGFNYTGPTLFLRGSKSDYILQEDQSTIKHYFPNSTLVDIPDAGHNLHIDNMPKFIQTVKDFINPIESTP